MKSLAMSAVLLFLVAGLSGCPDPPAKEIVVEKPAKPDGQFPPIFNGKDLSGWKLPKEAKFWSAKDGTIVCAGTPGAGGYLHTERRYGDFILSIEYKVKDDNANSGVFFRVDKPSDVPGSGFEVQVLGDYGKEPNLHSAGALYGTVAPPKNHSRPTGEWNKFVIVVSGRWMAVYMNGHFLYNLDMDDPELNARVAKSPRKDLVPSTRKHNTGHIALQNHGNWVAYRNIRILELTQSSSKGD